MMANAGGEWDSAKKYVGKGYRGGKNSDAHRAAVAAVVGDTGAIRSRDTSGPRLSILPKHEAIVAVVFGPLFL